MKIHLVAGLLGSGRQRVFTRLIQSLASPDTTVVYRFIGLVVDFTQSETLSDIVDLIQDNPNVDHIILTGDGLTMYLQAVMAAYPDAAVYIVRRIDSSQELRQKTLDALMEQQQVDAQTALNFNTEVRPDLDAIVTNAGLTWNPVDDSVFVDNSNTPSYLIGGNPMAEIAVKNL